jgi:oxalate decarboxylase/phosphoglucose isomerase-like protein (cupin superfamily)
MSTIVSKSIISSSSSKATGSTTTTPYSAPAPVATVDAAAASAAAAKALAVKKTAELLRTKVTAVDRNKILFATNPDEPNAAKVVIKSGADLASNLIFDFSNAVPGAGEFGGKKKAATVDSFPFLTGMGLSTTVATLNPCGMNTPHVHPRGNEFLTVVDGTLSTGMILENGFTKEITGTLNKLQGTIFPQGAIHYQFNPTCAPATFVATLNNEDAGTNSVAQGFFGLNGDVVNAALGFQSPVAGADIEKVRASIPVSLAQGIEQCLKTCGIAKIPVA